MHELVIALATPVFFLLIFIELAVGLIRNRNTYRYNDAINSISLGLLNQVSAVFTKLIHIAVFAWLSQSLPWPHITSHSLWVWGAALVIYDLCYYWFHRLSHEVNLFWAAHVVHHQSEDYNLSTALRQTGTGELVGWVFYLPMVLLGFPADIFAGVALIDLLYQFWVHTQQIGALGWFDRWFVSPKNHRLHHAANDHYLDRNYGGILLIWDRMFGSFMEEIDGEPIVYGTRNPLRSWNPLWANVEVYKGLWLDSWQTGKFTDKVRVWFARPGWHPADLAELRAAKPFDPARPLYNPLIPTRTSLYCLAQFTVALICTVLFLVNLQNMALPFSIACALWVTVSVWTIGGLLEGKSRHIPIETVRLVATAVILALPGPWPHLPAQTTLAASFAGLSLVALWYSTRDRPESLPVARA